MKWRVMLMLQDQEGADVLSRTDPHQPLGSRDLKGPETVARWNLAARDLKNKEIFPIAPKISS